MTSERVIEIVGREVATTGNGLVMEIVGNGVREDGEWWYVPVKIDFERVETTSQYMDVLEKIENGVLKSEDLEVLLVPVLE